MGLAAGRNGVGFPTTLRVILRLVLVIQAGTDPRGSECSGVDFSAPLPPR